MRQQLQKLDPIATSQATPSPIGIPKLTQVSPFTTVGPVTKGSSETHLSNVMGGAEVQLNSYTPSFKFNSTTVDRVSSIPALQDKSALLKGLVLVESSGNFVARSPANAVGLTQLTPAAASDVGVTDRTDPDQNVAGGAKYLEMQEAQVIQAYQDYYKKNESQLTRDLSAQGFTVKPDPRLVLAAYNGGARWIRNGIAAGNLDWDSMREYLKRVKSPAASKENIEYPDKVIQASISFIKGGNASDEAYIQSLNSFGIIEVA